MPTTGMPAIFAARSAFFAFVGRGRHVLVADEQPLLADFLNANGIAWYAEAGPPTGVKTGGSVQSIGLPDERKPITGISAAW